MTMDSRSELERALLLLVCDNYDRELSVVVEELRDLADDASIKAAILRLNCEGVLQITPEWKVRRATAAGAGV
jgi:hypothetical protein